MRACVRTHARAYTGGGGVGDSKRNLRFAEIHDGHTDSLSDSRINRRKRMKSKVRA